MASLAKWKAGDAAHRISREAVQLQAERTRAILDSVLVGIVTVGDGGIEWMNRSARRMFGGELADFVGATSGALSFAAGESSKTIAVGLNNDAVAETVVNMKDRYVVGGFYRVHTDRGPDENLNAPGMHFVPLAFEQNAMPDHHAKP